MSKLAYFSKAQRLSAAMIAVGASSFLLASSPASLAQNHASQANIFLGTAIPEPPQQHSPWIAPSGVPEPIVSAAKTLFDQGLADPRGGEYREISIAVGSTWSGSGGVMKTHGWVLPSSNAKAQRFAVCWNGLTYPILSTGAPVDLAADVNALIQAEEGRLANFRMQNLTGNYLRWDDGAPSDAESAGVTAYFPIKGCLLLRLGETDLAQRFWKAWNAGESANNNATEKQGPYLLMASDWAWALFDRTVTAHMRGDDELSTISARLLTAAQPKIEAEAARRGYALQDTSYYSPPVAHGYLKFVLPLPGLLADDERRIHEKKKPATLDEARAISRKPERIAALIGILDQVNARQWDQPGGVYLETDPIVQALIAEGDDAIDPLIHTLATDKRLTRSVSFGRSFFRNRYPISVPAAAYSALASILHTSEFGAPWDGAGDNGARAASIKTYWDKYRRLPLHQRWRQTLADDHATPKQWLEAAKNIVTPRDETITGGWIAIPARPHNQVPPAAGEDLRAKQAPSISDLMARRVHDIDAAQDKNSSNQIYSVLDASQMALYLSDWDMRAALPSLKSQFNETLKMNAAWRNTIDIAENDAMLAKLTHARVHCGDTSALADYTAWLKTASLKDLPWYNYSAMFEPLWSAPHDPATLAAASALFGDTRSPWLPLLQKRDGVPSSDFEYLAQSPLLGVAPFREMILASLADKTLLEPVTQGGPRPMNMQYDIDSYWPASPQPIAVRQCDQYAKLLASVAGMPDFQYDWPVEKRDAAIAQATAQLRLHGDRYGHDDQLTPNNNYDFPTPRALPIFPRLDHPATAQEVQSGLAIFSLPAGARLSPAPAFPIKARWVTDKRYGREAQSKDSAGKIQTNTQYAQDGYVWQAEETPDGKRYYGFAGPHDFAQAPAEEIEFPADNEYLWSPLSSGIACSVIPPRSVKRGADIPMILRLRNQAGTPRIASTVAGDSAVLSPGISILVDYSPYSQAIPYPETPTIPGYRAISAVHPIPLKDAVRRPLEPTAEYDLCALNLAKFFDFSQEGIYRVRVQFDENRCGFGGVTRSAVIIVGTPPAPPRTDANISANIFTQRF